MTGEFDDGAFASSGKPRPHSMPKENVKKTSNDLLDEQISALQKRIFDRVAIWAFSCLIRGITSAAYAGALGAGAMGSAWLGTHTDWHAVGAWLTAWRR